MMITKVNSIFMLCCLAVTATLFSSHVTVGFTPSLGLSTRNPSMTALNMANDEDLLRWARASRSASADDTVVELNRPIGVILAEDDSGNVYVETVAPNGNAARSGLVRSCKK